MLKSSYSRHCELYLFILQLHLVQVLYADGKEVFPAMLGMPTNVVPQYGTTCGK